MVVQSVRASFSGFPFFPIFLSFCVSLLYLKKTRSRVATTASVKRQEKASSTIILFTSLYVICNVPVTVYAIYLTSLVADLLNKASRSVSNEITFTEYKATFSGTYFERHYVWILGVNLSVVLNSTLNPILYIWRMRRFRDFVINMGFTPGKTSSSSNGQPCDLVKDSKL